MPILSKTYRVIAMDTPGYGNSDKPSRVYEVDDFAECVVDFLHALGLRRTSIAGHLTGASIAVEVAAGRPDLVEKLVLVSCPYYDPEELEERLSTSHFGIEEIKEDGSHLIDLWKRYKAIMPEAKPESLQKTILGYLLAGLRAHDGHQAVFRYRVEERLPLIACPTLLISGGQYDIFHSQLEVIRKRISLCKTAIIEWGGDLVPVEKPLAFSQLTLDFLSDPQV
jgi:pimeloyl-ACP methyl ester carboxylesterase